VATCDVKRLVLVGYGRIAPKHLEVFRHLGCEIVASCNRSEEGRQKAKTEGGISRTYSEIGQMIEREKPDGVLCCTTFDQIYNAACTILPFGIPTLLEKPPGTSVDELKSLMALALEGEAPVMVGLNRKHYSILHKAIEDSGGLEAVTEVSVEWSEDPQHFARRGFGPRQIANMIFGNSLHGLDLLTYIAGPISQPHVLARDLGYPFRWQMLLEGISLRGVLAVFYSTWDSPGRWKLTFCVSNRRYTFAPLEACVVNEKGNHDDRIIEPDSHDRLFKPGFYKQAEAFLKMIDSGCPPEDATLEASLPAVSLAAALTEALKPTVRESSIFAHEL